MREVGMLALEAERHEIRQAQRPGDLHKQVAALRAQNYELAAFAHTVAHNLKDPLSVIIGTSDAIFHISDLTTEELQAYLQQIESTAHAMNDMIDNLLLLSEVEDIHVPAEPLDMGSIVPRVQARLGYLVREHRAHISAPGTWPVAIGYGPWVEEVWANLISNAIKYGGQPPRVELGATTRPDGMAVFWARDNGMGIAPEAQAQLFRPFTQLGPVRTPGHGLGLSIVCRIVERLGGQVGVQTEVGRGSQFFFTLPTRA
jgi:signal transduction histidine kinase